MPWWRVPKTGDIGMVNDPIGCACRSNIRVSRLTLLNATVPSVITPWIAESIGTLPRLSISIPWLVILAVKVKPRCDDRAPTDPSSSTRAQKAQAMPTPPRYVARNYHWEMPQESPTTPPDRIAAMVTPVNGVVTRRGRSPHLRDHWDTISQWNEFIEGLNFNIRPIWRLKLARQGTTQISTLVGPLVIMAVRLAR